MSSYEENLLNSEKNNYNNINIPDTLDSYILKGIQEAKASKKNQLVYRLITMAASFMLIIFVSAARFSPVFADYMQDIPVLGYIVKLINYDKGLLSAVENNFIQNIGASDEHKGLKLTVDSIIIDESQMKIFYTLENKADYKYIGLSNISFTDTDGNKIKASYSLKPTLDMSKEKQIHNVIDINFTEESDIPDILTIEVQLFNLNELHTVIKSSSTDKPIEISQKDSNISLNKSQPTEPTAVDTWRLNIPIDKSKFENLKQEYVLNETIVIEEQKITFNKITIYPTKIGVEIECNPSNTKKIFSFEDLVLIDENEEEYSSIQNGIVARQIDENRHVLYFQSNYFKNPETLYIKGSSIRAMDKDKINLKLDLDKGILINPPDDRLSFKEKITTDTETILNFNLKSDSQRNTNDLFSSIFKDSASKEYLSGGSGHSSIYESGVFIEKNYISIPKDKEYTNPITLTLVDYPITIKGEFKIRVK